MSSIVGSVRRYAVERPAAEAVRAAGTSLSYVGLAAEISALAARLDGTCVGLLLDNGPAWVVADLAAMERGLRCVPLPTFFSPQQLCHAIRDAGVDIVLTDQVERITEVASVRSREMLSVGGNGVELLAIDAARTPTVPDGTVKITYTSGSTGEPRGVCLNAAAMQGKARALAAASGASAEDRTLCLMPLSTLLENIGGVYAPLLIGATCCVPALREVGLNGSGNLHVASLLQSLQSYRPSSVIVVPQMLRVLVEAVEQGTELPNSLRFIAVGGAPVSVNLLRRAARAGLPVFEGYGLTEAASVVSLNRPGEVRIGSVGRPLPGITVSIADDGEILLYGDGIFLGYLGGDDCRASCTWPTGDLGHVDEDGYVYVTGRKKHIFITAHGRNVSPEWVERELLAQPAIGQAAVFGEGMVGNVALLVPVPGADREAVANAVRETNRTLPDYARVSRHVIAEPFTLCNGQLTGTGRVRRDAIAASYAHQLEQNIEWTPALQSP